MPRKRAVLFPILCFAYVWPVFAAREPSAAFYINLKQYPLYLREGFELSECHAVPDDDDARWIHLKNWNRAVVMRDFDFSFSEAAAHVPAREGETADYTMLIPFTIDEATLSRLASDYTITPALFFAALGDNWVIYLNGKLIKNEMYRGAGGAVTTHRSYRALSFPLDESILKSGKNYLAIHIAGDAQSGRLGFYHASPFYISSYSLIQRRNDETITLMLISLYIIMGIYHLFMFSLHKRQTYNLCFALLSLCAGVYFFMMTHTVYNLFPNSATSARIEYFTVFLIPFFFGCFIETFSFAKIRRVTKLYGAFVASLSLVQLLPLIAVHETCLKLWQISCILFVPVVSVDLIHGFKNAVAEMKKERENAKLAPLSALPLYLSALPATSNGQIIIGATVCIVSSIADIFDSAFLHYYFRISRFGFFILTFGIALILARRAAAQFRRQERIIARAGQGMNAKLVDWIVVQDRDPHDLPSVNEKIAVLFSDVRQFTTLSEKMDSQSVTEFLSALNEQLVKPMIAFTDRGEVAYTDKFVGDAMMNIFASPEIALKTAVAYQEQLARWNTSPDNYFKGLPQGTKIEVGCGLSYGAATIGIMGHSRHVDYTPLGDTVNIASRLQGLSKVYHSTTILNEAVFESVNKEAFNLRLLDRVRLFGKQQSVVLYEEYSSDSEAVRMVKQAAQPLIDELQDLYFSGRNIDKALSATEKVSAFYREQCEQKGLAETEIDALPRLYAGRLRFLQENDITRWDGIWRYDIK